MRITNGPDAPVELWGLWMPAPSRGKPRWLEHMHGSPWGRGGPMVFYTREEAEEQATDDDLEPGEVFVAVRMMCTPESGIPTP